MKIKSLSATSAQVFELCESRWKSEKIDYGDQVTNKAAALGTVCHEAIQMYVERGDYLREPDDKVMTVYYTMAFEKLFADKTHYAEGLKMVLDWMHRQEWTGKKVLSTEVKENFMLPTSEGEVPVNYIWDRCDELEGGEVEVVDYKSGIKALTHEQLRHNVQARLYGLAAQLKYPSAPRVWVTFDYLRHLPVGVVFTKEQNRETWFYMRRLAERIIASDGDIETLNEQCRWCVRRHQCKTLKQHIASGGPLGITDPFEAADKRAQLVAARGAIATMIDELDNFIIDYMEQEELPEFATTSTKVSITMKTQRDIDERRAAMIIGPQLMAERSGVTLTMVDKFLKGTELTPEKKAELRKLIFVKNTEAKVKTEVIPAL